MKTPGQIADIIERFLSGTQLYAQEFNDFFECSLPDDTLDAYRERCEILHVAFEPGAGPNQEQAAILELEQMVAKLRLLEQGRKHA